MVADPYAVLGLARTAGAEEVRRAYFAQVRDHPPEREPETFKRIRAAYESLRDPERRLETDMLLPWPWADPSPRRRLPPFDLAVHPEDVLAAARAFSDLGRSDWHHQFGKIPLA
jgi:curved DNA-binding protein CbpA